MNRFAFKALTCIIWTYLFILPCSAFAAGNVKSALLYNMSTGKILFERNANMQVAPASLTKIMTMFLVMDAISAKKITFNQKIRISAQAAKTGGSAMRLTAGEKVPVVRLLTGMAVASGNDAATALAIHLGGTEKKFVSQMNARAARLGMKRTKYKNPTGLPAAGQKTTARDLLLLCRAYLKKYPSAMRFHGMKYYMHKGSVARNTNPLLGAVKGVDGLKTGWTVASGYNIIITAQREKTRLLAIVLGGTSKNARDDMARKLINAGFKYPNNPLMIKNLLR